MHPCAGCRKTPVVGRQVTPEPPRARRCIPEASGCVPDVGSASSGTEYFLRARPLLFNRNNRSMFLQFAGAGNPDLLEVCYLGRIYHCRILPEDSLRYSRNSGSPAIAATSGFRAICPIARSKATGYSIKRGIAKASIVVHITKILLRPKMPPRKDNYS